MSSYTELAQITSELHNFSQYQGRSSLLNSSQSVSQSVSELVKRVDNDRTRVRQLPVFGFSEWFQRPPSSKMKFKAPPSW